MDNISATLIQKLRQRTGAGMMDCKKALVASNGDIVKAEEWLRKKGAISAGSKAERNTSEGTIGSYIHTGGKVGVMVEVNCETDFVARTEDFQALVRAIAMQIVACPNVEYVKVGDVPVDLVSKETSIEMERDDLANKPANIREKIVKGRIDKRLQEMCLLNQYYVRNQDITIEELIQQNIAKLGENIQVRRFVRFALGEV